MHAGSVNLDDLRARPARVRWNLNDTQNPIAGSLWFGAYNREFPPDQRIQQRRFTGIWPAENAYETRAEGHWE